MNNQNKAEMANLNPSKKKTTTAPVKWKIALNLLTMLRGAEEHEDRLLFALGFYTGFRISDILSLTWEQALSSEIELIEKKTGKQRNITVNLSLAKIAKEVYKALGNPDRSSFIFTGKKGIQTEKPLTVVGANKRIKRILTTYEIETQNPSSHTLRKTFALRVYESLGRTEDALVMLSKILNHSKPSVTREYIGITAQRITNVYLSI